MSVRVYLCDTRGSGFRLDCLRLGKDWLVRTHRPLVSILPARLQYVRILVAKSIRGMGFLESETSTIGWVLGCCGGFDLTCRMFQVRRLSYPFRCRGHQIQAVTEAKFIWSIVSVTNFHQTLVAWPELMHFARRLCSSFTPIHTYNIYIYAQIHYTYSID